MINKGNWIIIAITLCILAVGIYFFVKKSNEMNSMDSRINPAVKFFADKSKPRGIRNNNPGNIRISTNAWKGKVPKEQNSDGSFEQFSEMKWGVRAMMVLVRNWIKKGTTKNLKEVIQRYAPAVENDTQKYIDFVSSRTGIDPNAPLSADESTLKKMVRAMIIKENGDGHVSDSDINEGWNLA